MSRYSQARGRGHFSFGHLQANRRGPQAVGEELEFLAGPGVNERARAVQHLPLGIPLVAAAEAGGLRDAIGEQEADQAGLLFLPQANVHRLAADDLGGVAAGKEGLDSRAEGHVVAAVA